MYFRERVEFVSRKLRRRETALKKDSWIVGRAEEDDVVGVVLFRGWVELCILWIVDAVGGCEIGVSDVWIVLLDAVAGGESLMVSCDIMDSLVCVAVDLIIDADAFEAGTGL